MAEQNLAARLIAKALSLKPVRAYLLYAENQGAMLADSITYRTLFSLFAGVLLGFSVLGIVLAGDPDALSAVVDAVNGAVPGLLKTSSDASGLLDVSTLTAPAAFTVAGIVSVLGLVGAAIGAIGSMRTAMRHLAGTLLDDAAIYWVILRNLGLAIGIGVGLVVSAGVTFLGTAGIGLFLDWFGVGATSAVGQTIARLVTIAVALVLDAAVIAVLVRVLSGLKPRPRVLWIGALLGGVGLIVLQQLSGLFVGGARSNPLLASFASLIALLLWLNLSSQVILIATAYIVVGVEEEHDRVHAVHGAATFAERRVQQAERGVRQATDELRQARMLAKKERDAAEKAAKKASG